VTRRDWLAEEFERHRRHLRAVAYRMLGSVSEAEDAVQEAWLRLDRSDPGGTDDLRGWLTVVVGRICLDALRRRKARREQLAGSWLPEPIVCAQAISDPERSMVVADSVGLALLVVLETLTPPERLAFVLHDVFGMPFDQIAPVVERSPAATRQLASRARRRIRAEAPQPDADFAVQREVVDPSSPPHARATLRRSFRCWIRMSSSGSTAAPGRRDRSRGHRSLVPRRWPLS